MVVYSIADFTHFLSRSEVTLPAHVSSALAALDKEMAIVANNAEKPAKKGGKDAVHHFSVSNRAQAARGDRAMRRESDGESKNAFSRVESRRTVIACDDANKDITEVRTFLNKISNKNYEKQKDAIILFINGVVGRESTDADMHKIAQFVFDIASTNKFFSEIYADLYKALVDRFAVFSDILEKFVVSYTDPTAAILYADPAIDYDAFCLYTKCNDCRKATASFIVMLMLRDVLSIERVAGIVDHYVKVFETDIDSVGRGNEAEEVAEVLFVFITLGKTGLKRSSLWTTYLLPAVSAIAKMKPRERPSLTNRAVFKFMDIVDKLRA